MIDLLASLLILFFAWKGYRRGLASSLMDLAGLLVSMVAAYFWVNPLGLWISTQHPEAGLWSYLAASTCIFMGVFLVFQIPSWILGFRNRKRQNEGQGSILSAWGGAVLNGVVGFAYVLGLLWVSMLWVGPGFGTQAEGFRTPLQKLSGKAMGSLAQTFVPQKEDGDGLWPGLARAYSNDPGSAMKHLKTFLDHRDVAAIVNGADPHALIWDEGAKTTHLKRLMSDATFVEACGHLGLWSPQDDDVSKRERLDRSFREIQLQIDRLQNLPKVRELLSDPEFRRAAQQRDVTALLGDPRLVSLWGELRSQEPFEQDNQAVQNQGADDGPAEVDMLEQTPETQAPPQKKMYRWRDENGQINITDEPPPKTAEEF